MARFGVLVAAVTGVLLAVYAGAAPASSISVADLCKPQLCMVLAILHSRCYDGLNPGPVTSGSVAAIPTQLTQCVCADPKLKESYFNCYGGCTIDEATEPFCSQPVEDTTSDDDEASLTSNTQEKYDPNAPPKCRGPMCDHWDPKLSGMEGRFCVVPGQACYNKAVDVTDDADATEPHGDVTEFQRPEITGTRTRAGPKHDITASAELNIDLAEHDAYTRLTGPVRTWTGKFCVVPGQACYDKDVVAPTAAPGSDFVDVGDAESDELEGKIGSGGKRAVGFVQGPVLKTLETVKNYVRPSV